MASRSAAGTSSEVATTRKIVAFLRKAGYWVLKVHGGPMQMAGVPDLLAIKQGRAVFFEVKSATGSVSKLQTIVMDQLSEHGAVVHVVRSVAEVEELLDGGLR